MEVLQYSLIVREDLDLGTGTRSLRMQDGSLVTVNQIQLSSLAALITRNVTATNGATVLTLTAMIPAGAFVLGVTTEVLTGLGTSGGLTGFSVGDGTTVDRWGTQTDLTAGAQTDGEDFTLEGIPKYSSATDMVITAVGGTFNGTGSVEVSLHFYFVRHRRAS